MVQAQQLAKLVQHVGITQEVFAFGWTVFEERALDFFEHTPQFLFGRSCHHRRRLAIDAVGDVRDVFVVFVEFEAFENLFHFGRGDVGHIVNAFFLEFDIDAVVHIVGDIGGFFRLELGQPFVEMVDSFVGIIRGPFSCPILVGRPVGIHQHRVTPCTFGVRTQQHGFVMNQDTLFPTIRTYIDFTQIPDILTVFDKIRVGALQVLLQEDLAGLVLAWGRVCGRVCRRVCRRV